MNYTVWSPDGIPIAEDTFPSLEAAKKALTEWVKMYRVQEYYAAADGRAIPLSELADACEITPDESDEDEDGDPEDHEQQEEELGVSDDNWACGTLDPET